MLGRTVAWHRERPNTKDRDTIKEEFKQQQRAKKTTTEPILLIAFYYHFFIVSRLLL